MCLIRKVIVLSTTSYTAQKLEKQQNVGNQDLQENHQQRNSTNRKHTRKRGCCCKSRKQCYANQEQSNDMPTPVYAERAQFDQMEEGQMPPSYEEKDYDLVEKVDVEVGKAFDGK